MAETIDYGIDLGTTNSSIAVCRNGDVRIFQTVDLTNVTPSVVYVSKAGRMLVGKKAYDTWVADPRNTQAEFKRWMGYSDQLEFPASGKSMSAEELSAEVLKSLRADVQRQSGEGVSASVITVPAAFGSLQCDATAKAAKLAGLDESPLLQEPIAAAIAYGATPASQNQRWMVFDLGGGTLDIAVVSTRNGRLAVLEHQGDNRLGGKDLDRLLAEFFLHAPLAQTFRLPTREADPQGYERLMRALVREAEQAKIALSTAPTATVDLIDLGEDRDGKPIELTLTLQRGQVESAIRPTIEKCIQLAHKALQGARLSKADLDRILLVGGPTQMPILREALAAEIAPRLDHSLDPMTVVARGAALFASTLERTTPSRANAVAPAAASSSAVAIQLAFERASGTLQSPVAGILPAGGPVSEVKIDSEGGLWTSGWIPVADGCFQTEVMLSDRKPVTLFAIAARDKAGNGVEVTPAQFCITYMLPMAAPPLPHTIAIELSTTHGVSNFDPVFKRHCPLPAEARKTYRADQTLRPSDTNASIPIKFWEIEVSDDPQEKWWAGCVHLRAEQLKRPIVEGSELELTVKIDKSRKMTVEVFIPLLNQSFVDGVYIPDPPSARSQLQQQIDLCCERMDHIRKEIYEADRDDLREKAEALQQKLEAICLEVSEERKSGSTDPDAAMEPTAALRRLRVQLAQLEEQLEMSGPATLAREIRAEARWTEHVIMNRGTDADRAEFQRLSGQMEKYIDGDDQRGLKWVRDQYRSLRWPILENLPEFWLNVLGYLKQPSRRFLNRTEAEAGLKRAEQAERDKNLPELRDAVCRVWDMQPADQVQVAKEQAAQSGLRSI